MLNHTPQNQLPEEECVRAMSALLFKYEDSPVAAKLVLRLANDLVKFRAHHPLAEDESKRHQEALTRASQELAQLAQRARRILSGS